ncbi:NUDIX hydrolase [Rubritalea spongiae]
MSEIEVLYEGTYLGLYKNGHWEYALRPNASACVTILPITDTGEVVLVEQFRIPTQSRVIEIPAGLVGDEPEYTGETLAECAARELLEETGYCAGKITELIASPTSAGMTPEITHMFAATDLNKVHAGGGVEGENITVHVVPSSELDHFLAQKHSEGYDIDFKIHASLYKAQELGLL